MYVKKMSLAIRGADRSRERTKQTTALPIERLERRRSVRRGSRVSARTAHRLWMEKSKEHSVFRAGTSGVSLNSCSFVQWVHLYHYCTIKWFIVIDICLNRSHNSGYSVSNYTSAPPWSTPGCWRREWLWGRRSGSTGESLCSQSERESV